MRRDRKPPSAATRDLSDRQLLARGIPSSAGGRQGEDQRMTMVGSRHAHDACRRSSADPSRMWWRRDDDGLEPLVAPDGLIGPGLVQSPALGMPAALAVLKEGRRVAWKLDRVERSGLELDANQRQEPATPSIACPENFVVPPRVSPTAVPPPDRCGPGPRRIAPRATRDAGETARGHGRRVGLRNLVDRPRKIAQAAIPHVNRMPVPISNPMSSPRSHP